MFVGAGEGPCAVLTIGSRRVDECHYPAVMSFAEPPDLAAPANPLPGLVRGYQGQPVPPAPAATVPAGS